MHQKPRNFVTILNQHFSRCFVICLQEKDRRLKTLRHNIVELKTAAENNSTKRAEIQTKIKSSNKSLLQVQKELQSSSMESFYLEQEVEKFENLLKSEEKFDEFNKIDNLNQSFIESLSTNLSNYEKKLKNKQIKIAKLENELNKFTNKNDSLQRQSFDCSSTKKNLERQIRSFELKLEVLLEKWKFFEVQLLRLRPCFLIIS